MITPTEAAVAPHRSPLMMTRAGSGLLMMTRAGGVMKRCEVALAQRPRSRHRSVRHRRANRRSDTASDTAYGTTQHGFINVTACSQSITVYFIFRVGETCYWNIRFSPGGKKRDPMMPYLKDFNKWNQRTSTHKQLQRSDVWRIKFERWPTAGHTGHALYKRDGQRYASN